MIEEIRNTLMETADEKYGAFNKSLVPGDGAAMLGVRMPVLRDLAKKLAKESGTAYIREIMAEERRGSAFHEELLLHGMVIGYMKCSLCERMELLDEFVPVIDSWAVCDSSCITYKFMKKDQEQWFSYLEKYIKSRKEYEIRFALVSYLNFFVNEEFVDRVQKAITKVDHEAYYVKMAAAWAISVCYVKFPEKTWELLERQTLEEFTQNKAIQKIRESRQVGVQEKERLLSLRRKPDQ